MSNHQSGAPKPVQPSLSMIMIDTAEAKERLTHLQELLPMVPDKIVYSFAAYLATKLGPQLIPRGFVVRYAVALHDVEAGTDRFTEEPIQGDFVGQPPDVYSLLAVAMSDIAMAIFPEHFAREVCCIIG